IFNDSYTLSPGSLQLSDSGSAQVISGRTARIFSELSGFSNFSKVGPGTLVLNNVTNTFNGTLSVAGGTLQIGEDFSLGGTTVVTLDSGTLATTGNFPSPRTYSMAAAGGMILASAGTTFSIISPLAANANPLTVNGTGTVTISGASSRTGATFVQNGTLSPGPGALGSGT